MSAKIQPFKNHVSEYEEWFGKYPKVYQAELRAIRSQMPEAARSVEIGVGTGKFCLDLGVEMGIDPSPEMLAIAKSRGVEAILGKAESLPFADKKFDLVVMITVLCFLPDPCKALREIYRIIASGGYFILAFVDRHSPLGKLYCQQQAESLFYRDAKFYGADEVASLMVDAGFIDLSFCQTIISPLAQVGDDEPVVAGSGVAGFGVVVGRMKDEGGRRKDEG